MEKRSSSRVRTSKCKTSQKKSSGGKITRNPFLNFLRDFRKSNKHKYDVRELTRRGAQLWRGMTAREKSPYVNLSKQAPRYKTARGRRRRRRGRRRRGSRRRRRRRRRHASLSSSSGCTEDDSTEEPTSEDEIGDVKNERSPVERKEKRKSQSHGHEDHQDNNNKNSGRNEHHENKERSSTSREKRNQDYELKYKNPKYEDTRDFI